MGRALLIGVMLAVLIAAVWLAVAAWGLGPEFDLPASAYVPMILGIVFTILVGSGLMALVFFSSRRGYDEPPQRMERDEGP